MTEETQNKEFLIEGTVLKSHLGENKEVVIPDGVTEIAEGAFSRQEIKVLTIPKSVKKVKSCAFSRCDISEGVHYEGTLSDWCRIEFRCDRSNPLKVAHNLYINNELVTELTIPEDITVIGDAQFAGWYGKKVTLHNKIERVGHFAFDDGYYIKDVYYNGDLSDWCKIKLDDVPFKNSGNLHINGELLTELVIPDTVTTVGKDQFRRCSIQKVILPGGVKNIEMGAFFGCEKLESITIPASVTNIGSHAFSCCNNLKSVYYTGSLTDWLKIRFDDDGANPIGYKTIYPSPNFYINSELVTEIDIPDTVTTIGKYQLDGWNGTRINFNKVTNIEEHAFRGCQGITELTFPETLTTIGNGAFAFCYNLQSVSIPDSVTSIGESAFIFCEKLENPTLPKSVTDIGYRAFYGCRKVEKA